MLGRYPLRDRIGTSISSSTFVRFLSGLGPEPRRGRAPRVAVGFSRRLLTPRLTYHPGRHLSDDIPLIAASQRLVSRPLGLTLL